jgi:hypothetical protein
VWLSLSTILPPSSPNRGKLLASAPQPDLPRAYGTARPRAPALQPQPHQTFSAYTIFIQHHQTVGRELTTIWPSARSPGVVDHLVQHTVDGRRRPSGPAHSHRDHRLSGLVGRLTSSRVRHTSARWPDVGNQRWQIRAGGGSSVRATCLTRVLRGLMLWGGGMVPRQILFCFFFHLFLALDLEILLFQF